VIGEGPGNGWAVGEYADVWGGHIVYFYAVRNRFAPSWSASAGAKKGRRDSRAPQLIC
jgi:hypothetical protein